MIKLNIVCWNCEDFFVYRQLRFLYQNRKYNQTLKDNLEYTPIIDRLQEAHIILLQEWNEDNGDFVKTYLSDYGILNQDRTAILYKKSFFEKNVQYVEIPLLHEPPTRIERTYTTGRQKRNIFARLFYETMPIYIGCFHLSAFSPSQHPGFHKRQLNDYLNKCISSDLFRTGHSLDNSESYNSEFVTPLDSKYGFIIGGDTNFNDGFEHSNLFNDLINNEIITSLKLTDVCTGLCNTVITQDPVCMHEKDVGKTIAKSVSKLKDFSSRLDLLMINETITAESTNIIKDCNISDHSLISCKTTFELEEVSSSSQMLDGGKKNYLKKRTRRNRRKRKTRKTKPKNKKRVD
jgi:hypothetical protein